MIPPRARLLRIFVTGLLAALPLLATAAVVWWVFSLILSWVGPDSGIGRVLVAVGFSVTGSVYVGYLVGVAAVLLGIFGLGMLVTHGLQRGAVRLLEATLKRIPLVGSVYEMARRLVALFAQRQGGGMQSMSAVWCHFGGPPEDRDSGSAIGRAGDLAGDLARKRASPSSQGVVVLGLLSTPEPVFIDGQPYLGLIVPTAPVPVGGGLLYVPQHWVRPAAMGIEAVTSIYVSMGMTSSEHLPTASGTAAVSGSGRDSDSDSNTGSLPSTLRP